ncbi:hypothetical protein ACSBR1_019452 [Camellia fascicularis]
MENIRSGIDLTMENIRSRTDLTMEKIRSTVEIVKNLSDLIGPSVEYHNHLDTKMETLKRKTEQLNGRNNDISKEVNFAEQRSRKRRRDEVRIWQEEVRRITGHVQTLEREEQELRQLHNAHKRAKLGKRVVEKIKEVEKLHENGGFSNGLLIDDPTCGHAIPTTESLAETTSVRNKEKIWNFLMDDAVRKIGVHGMGGVGKTTIMKHINNKLLVETCTFSDVIWVTVSKGFDIKNLQRQIAKKLILKLSDDEDELCSATEIHNMLSQKKRYVLILDDLWKAFPLEEVGIPEPAIANGCKLVLTTQSSEVCTKMNCSIVEIELLTEEEALNLFMKNVEGHQTVLTPEVKEIAKEVAKKCSRLPLAIVVMAGCMRGVNDIREWKNARNAQQLMGIEERLFEQLEFSYSRLKNEQEKHCFLYCALYPEDHDIDRQELIEYWIAEGLISEMNSIEAMFNEGHTILNKLIKTCLLVEGIIDDEDGRECVKMHDLIRDMALKITSTSPRFMVRAGEGLKRVPHKDWSKDLERVSLMRNDIEELPSKPICPRLTTFLGRGSLSKVLQNIPDSFFLCMRRLKVLDLSYTAIKSLPKSISKLENLHQLLLSDCRELEYVPSLEKLKALEHFELTYSQIEEVPQGIGELVNLRKLVLCENRNIKYVPSLERLKALEHVALTDSQIKEVPQGIGELVNLRKLVLCENRNIKYVPSLERLKALEHFALTDSQIKEVPQGIEELVNLKTLVLSGEYLGMSPCRKLCRLTQLHTLIWPTEVKVSAEELLCLKQLKFLYAQFHNEQELTKYMNSAQCKSLEGYNLKVRIVDESNLYTKKRTLTCMYDSDHLYSNGVDAVVLPSDIKYLEIRSWDNHISLSDIQLLRNAKGLRKFVIHECRGLQSVFSSSSPSSSSSSCISEDNHIPLTTIEVLRFRKLPNFRVLFDRVVPPHYISFNLKILVFWKCPKIANIFSALLLHNFPNLEALDVHRCENVDEIIVVERSDRGGHRGDDGNTITLPNLKTLRLVKLPRLESIYKGIMVCESLQLIAIGGCPMLRRLPISLHMNEDGEQASAPPALERIIGEEEWWESLEWDNPLTKTTLQPLFDDGYPAYEDIYKDEDHFDEEVEEEEEEEEEEEDEEEEEEEDIYEDEDYLDEEVEEEEEDEERRRRRRLNLLKETK